MLNRNRLADKTQQWQAPSFLATGSERMGWLEEAAIQEGENWIKGQTAYSDIPKGLNIISGRLGDDAQQKRSQLNINHAKYDIRKIVGTLSDIREIGGFQSDIRVYADQAAMLTKSARAVALEGEFPRRLRMALQYGSISSVGYIWPKAERLRGKEMRINFEPMGLLDVLPVQIPQDNNLQGAYIVTCIVFMPVYLAHGKFPEFQDKLKPIARRRYTSSVSARRLDLQERFKYGETDGSNWANLYCELRYSFINDLSMNPFPDKEVPMGDFDEKGEPKTSWSYKVPYLGQEIPDHVTQGGVMVTRPAEPEDCMLYPNLRLMISSKGMNKPMYDGPAKDLHGMMPPVPFCMDDWPWEPLGFSLAHDIHSIERSRQAAERGIDQIAKSRLDPSLGYDRSQGLNDVTALTIDPFEERGRIGVDGEVRKVIDALLPEWLMNVPVWIENFIKYLNEKEDAQLGLNEIQNLAEFKATLQSDNALDKATSLVGPIVKDIGSGMESSVAKIWQMLKFMIPQHFTTRRIMQWVGPDGITPETFDYDPSKIVPSHGPDEFHNRDEKEVIAKTSVYTDSQRLKLFCNNVRLTVVPHRLLGITQMEEQLKWTMLFRSGFPMAPHDLAKKLNIDNFGEIEGETIWDRYVNYKEKELEIQAKLAQLAQSLLPPGAEPPKSPGTGKSGGQKTTGGRPPSGGQAPKIKAKSGGPLGAPRTTVSESG